MNTIYRVFEVALFAATTVGMPVVVCGWHRKRLTRLRQAWRAHEALRAEREDFRQWQKELT